MSAVPHLRIVVAVTIAAIFGYAMFSLWVVLASNDVALKGDVIGTWKSFAVLGFGFWLGSSSAGKAKETDSPPPPAPHPVEVVNGPDAPVPVEGKA